MQSTEFLYYSDPVGILAATHLPRPTFSFCTPLDKFSKRKEVQDFAHVHKSLVKRYPYPQPEHG